jgi:predicted phage terminase large subunit-like protein
VQRVRVEYTELRDRIIAQKRRWKADEVLIEDAGAGSHMWSDLRHRHDWRPVMIQPIADKITRMVAQLAMIEDGDLLLPHEAPWLTVLLSEMRAFPDATHDDQVDALSQFLAWAKANEFWALTVRDPRTGKLVRPSRHEMQALRERRTHRINSRGN